jgi:hypothetical protein
MMIKPQTRRNKRGYLEVVEPEFSSYEEMAEWWNQLDLSDIWDELEPVELIPGKRRPLCGNCRVRMRTYYVNVDRMDGKIVLRKVKQYRCPRCGRTELSQEGATEVETVTKSLEGKLSSTADAKRVKEAAG